MNIKTIFTKKTGNKFTLTGIKAALLEAAKSYYNEGESLFTDDEYDRLATFYEERSGEKLPVGAPAVGTTVDLKHSYEEFAGTLSKCKNVQDLKTWMKNKGVKGDLLTTIKADGHSITVEWVYDEDLGEMIIDKALTRGADGKGKDLTRLFKDNASCVPSPSVEFNIAVGYEAVVTNEDFIKLNEDLGGKFKNPRSAMTGIMSNSGKHLFKDYVTLIPLRVKAEDETNLPSAEDNFKVLSNMDNYFLLQAKRFSNIKDIEELYELHEADRISEKPSLVEFMYDGLVFEVTDTKLRKKLGHTSTEPNYATALKFTPIDANTTVIEVNWSTEGSTARFTPVVSFDPVVIRGNTYSKVSLANLERFKSLRLRKGTGLKFALRNDTLGYVELNGERDEEEGQLIQSPTHCPSCGSELERSVFLDCVNRECDLNRIGQIYGFINKLGVKNFGLETVRSLYNAGVITDLTDFIVMDVLNPHIAGVDGFGIQSADLLEESVNAVFVNPVNDYTLIGSLGIPMIGRSRMKPILMKIKFEDLLAASEMDKKAQYKLFKSAKVEGMGEILIDGLFAGIVENRETIECYREALEIVETYRDIPKDFKQLSFCHTGSADPFATRAELVAFIESKGHKVVGGVSKNTSYLINNDVASTTSKNAKAKELGVKIIPVSELEKLI